MHQAPVVAEDGRIGVANSRTALSMMASNTGVTSVVELLITRSTSLVAVWYSSDSLNSRVRSSTLRSSPAYEACSCVAHVVELLGQALEFVARLDLDALVELASADALGALLQCMDRPHQRAREEEALGGRQQQAAHQQQHQPHDGLVQRRQRLGARRLDEHRPVERRNARVGREHLRAGQVVRVDMAGAVGPRRARPPAAAPSCRSSSAPG